MTHDTPQFDPDPRRFEVDIPDEVQDAMRALVVDTQAKMPPGWGVTVFAFSYDGAATMYASSAQRADMIGMLRAFLVNEVRKL